MAFGVGTLSWAVLSGDAPIVSGSVDVWGVRLFGDHSPVTTTASSPVRIVEPMSAALAIVGLLGMLLIRRRRLGH